MENDELLTQMNSLSRYTIYAARYAANYHPSEKHSIIAGADVSRINGEGDMTTEPALVGYLNYKSKRQSGPYLPNIIGQIPNYR
jgi:hypothetical protein